MNKYVRTLVESNCDALSGCKTIENIFNIMFSRPNEIMAQWLEAEEEKSMTFGEGKERILSAAERLYAQIPQKGAFVALDMDNSVRWIICFWALLMIGCKPYLVNKRHPAPLTQGIINTLGIFYSVAEGDTSYPCMYIDANEISAEGGNAISPDKISFADEIAISTSATTLKEVVCIYNGERIANQILNCKSILLQNKQMPKFYHGALKQLAFLPFYHIFGLMAVYFWFSFFARPMVFIKDYSASSILSTVKRFEVTHIFAVPMLWHTIEKQVMAKVEAGGEAQIKKFRKGIALSLKLQETFPTFGMFLAKRIMRQVTEQLFGYSPRFLISGGGYIRGSALQLINALGYPLYNGYGMSETGITSVELRSDIKSRLQNSVGKPFDSVRYDINSDGTLQISGNSLCSLLIREGREIVIDDHYDSGDIASVDEHGNYYILGRSGDLIITESGENINPDEIEKTFAFPKAEQFCIFGYGDVSSQEIALVIRLRRDISKQDAKATADSAYALSDKLPDVYKIKKYFFSFDPLCADGSIKVSRDYLKRGISNGSIHLFSFDDVLSGSVSGREKVSEEDHLAMLIRSLFAEFTDRDLNDIYMDDHFLYDLGATSIDYFSLIMRINEELGIHIMFDKDGACHTIREFCGYIERLPEYRSDRK